MRISHEFKLIYFSIPKTGSEAIRSLLDPVSEEDIVTFPDVCEMTPFHSHMRPYDTRHVFASRGWPFERYLRFATVRNPWARLASLYKMVCRNCGDQWGGSFSDWVQKLDPTGLSTANMPAKWYAHGTMSMTTFLSDPEGRSLVDQVYRVEDQTEVLHDMITARVGADRVEQRVEHKNKAERPYDWRSMYSTDSRDRIAELYADDIGRFGYTFDPEV